MEPPGWGKHARKFYLWGVCGSGKLTTLASGKFYVGILEAFTGPRLGKEWVAMTPVASGHRNDTGSLHLSTFYDIQLPSEKSREVFKVVISTKEIVSAQSFDLALYQEFQAPEIELVGIGHEHAEQEDHAPSIAPSVINGSSLEKIRYFLYLGLPVFLLLAPYAALMHSSAAGWWCILNAGLSAKLAERLRS